MKTFAPLFVCGSIAVLFAACSGSSTAADSSGKKSSASATDDTGSDATGASTDDTGSACSKTTCGKECVDVKTSAKHCGKCNARCGSGLCTAGKCKAGLVFAVTEVFLGDKTRGGAKTTSAWQEFGRDIDGRTSSSTSTDHCKLVAGAADTTRDDGLGGIDNAFGHTVLPLIIGFAGNAYSQQVNEKLTSADFSMILRLDGVTAATDADAVTAGYFGGGPLPSPAFDGTDVWPITGASVTDGKVSAPKASFTNGTYKAGWFDSGISTGTATLYLPVSSDGGLEIPVRQLNVIMKTFDGRTATSGTLSGVIPTKDFLAIFKRDRGYIYKPLCQGTLIDGIAAQIEKASDIMVDGTQDSTATCDGISFGIGFDAAAVNLGDALPVPAAVDSCE